MTVNPWNPAPFPAHGDKSPDPIFKAIGWALTEWEIFEERLSWVFSLLVTERSGGISTAAIHAYGTIVAFQGRSQMVRAAAEAYQAERPETTAIASLLALLSRAGDFSGRRNEIAHGIVQPFHTLEALKRMEIDYENAAEPDGFALMPAFYNSKKNGLARAEWDDPAEFIIYRQPSYAYTEAPIQKYRGEFSKLGRLCTERWWAINHELWQEGKRRSSR